MIGISDSNFSGLEKLVSLLTEVQKENIALKIDLLAARDELLHLKEMAKKKRMRYLTVKQYLNRVVGYGLRR